MILEEFLGRIERTFGDKVMWMTPSELARYWATIKSYKVEVEPSEGRVVLRFSSPFSCPDFTVRLVPLEGLKVSSITADGRKPCEVKSDPILPKNS